MSKQSFLELKRAARQYTVNLRLDQAKKIIDMMLDNDTYARLIWEAHEDYSQILSQEKVAA